MTTQRIRLPTALSRDNFALCDNSGFRLILTNVSYRSLRGGRHVYLCNIKKIVLSAFAVDCTSNLRWR